jgi:uncharacterized protein YndB with AHSA1/START domain
MTGRDLTIDHEIVIDAPAEVVWATITEPEQISLWFADRVALDLRPGGEGTFAFEGQATAEPMSVPLVVDAVEPPHRFAFRWVQPEGETPEKGNSVLVEFTLVADGDERTRLRVTETELADLPWSDGDKAAYVDEHNEGWSKHLGRLAGVLGPSVG